MHYVTRLQGIKALGLGVFLLGAIVPPERTIAAPEGNPEETAASIDLSAVPSPYQTTVWDSWIVSVPNNRNLSPQEFFELYARRLGLSRDDEMIRHRTAENPTTGTRYVQYHQYHKGIRVSNGAYTLEMIGPFVSRGLGQIVSGLRVDTLPQIDEDRAVEVALLEIDRGTGPEAIASELETQDNSLLFAAQNSSLEAEQYRLVYRFAFGRSFDDIRWIVHVDSGTGEAEVFDQGPDWAWVTASGDTVYDGNNKTFKAELDGGGTQYSLKSQESWTRSLVNESNPWLLDDLWEDLKKSLPGSTDSASSSIIEITSPSPEFNLTSDRPGVSVHWGTQQVFSMFREWREKFDLQTLPSPDQPFPTILNFVQAPVTDGWASYEHKSKIAIYGRTGCPVTSLNVVGHEMGHYLQHEVASQLDVGTTFEEINFLKESFADIVGEASEDWTDIHGNDWVSGGKINCQLFKAIYPRNLKFPPASPVPKPAFYMDNYWQTSLPPGADTAAKAALIHNNSTVHSHWFYLLSEGGKSTNFIGQPYDITGIGMHAALKVMLDNFVFFLQSDFGYARAQEGSEWAAQQLCGEYSQEYRSTHEAWSAVGVYSIPGGPLPLTLPADGAVDVNPWPAQLAFQAGLKPLESEWEVQISENSDFTGLVQVNITSTTGLEGNTLVGKTEFELKPDTEYFWRVRPANSPEDFKCWRPARRFKTGSMSVTPLSPITERREDNRHHPWDLEFKWMPHPSASSYALQVSDNPVFGSPLFHDLTTRETELELDVLVDDWQYWRVRPEYVNSSDEVIHGTWSEVMFRSSMPTVQALSPDPGEQVYPWPVHFAWEPIKGAENFTFEIQLSRLEDGEADLDMHSTKLPPTQTTYQQFLRGDRHTLWYDWQVKVLGPMIESVGVQQEGVPGGNAFRNRGTSTIPDILTTGPNLCVPLQEPVNLQWKSKPNATAYAVYIYEAICPMNTSCKPGQLLEKKQVEAQPSGTQSTFYSPGPMPSQEAIGILWNVQSFGPGGMPGVVSTAFKPPILVQPSSPHLLEPVGLKKVLKDDPLALRWETPLAHLGGYILNMYKGSNSSCDGTPDLSEVVMGNASGVSSSTVSNLTVDSGTHNHSWKVRPFILGLKLENQHFESCVKPQWSQCGRFTVVESVADLPPPWVPDEFGTTQVGKIFAIWKTVVGANAYHVRVRKNSTTGPIVFNNILGTLVLQSHMAELAQALELDDGIPPGLWVAMIDVDPLSTYFIKVSSCDGSSCGDWSQWTEFRSGFGLPPELCNNCYYPD